MSTTSRLAISAAVLGSGLLLAAPAAAQEACPYPFDPSDARCQVQGGEGGGATGGEGAAGGGATGGEGAAGGGITGGSGGAGTVVDNSPVRNTAGGGGGAALPFTGGEVTLIALAGAAAVGGGVVLVAAGRNRATG